MSVIFFCLQFWGRKWLCQVYGRLAFFWFFLLEKPHTHKILVLGGGVGLGFFEEGGSANSSFVGAAIFLIYVPK